jgi:hypothetical protein
MVVLLALIFFIPWIFQGKIFIAADILYSFLPWSSYTAPGFRPHNPLISDPLTLGYPAAYNRQLKEGGLKDWNPLTMAGLPAIFSASTCGGHSYFLKNFYHRFFSPPTGIMLSLLTHLLLMGLFMYLYLFDIGAGWRGALFGAAAWMFSGYTMVWFEFELTMTAGACIPLLLLITERFLGPRRYLFACLGAIALAMYVFTQHLQFLLYIGVIMLFNFLFLAWRLHRREPGLRPLGHLVACFAITGAGALLIGAVELLPVAELILNSSRVARIFDFQGLFDSLGRVYYRYLVTLIFPDYYGSPVIGTNVLPRLPAQEYMNYNELCVYLGVPTLFALLAAAAGGRDLATRYWLLLTALFASMMVGAYTFYPFFKWFPGLGRLNPTRIIFLFTLAATVTAGLGVSALDGLSRLRRQIFVGGMFLLTAATLLLALVSARPTVLAWFNSEYANHPQWPFLSQSLAGMRSFSSPIMLKPLLLAAGAFLLFTAYVLLTHRRARLAVFALILAMLAYDLISFGWYYNTASPPEHIFARTPAIDFIKGQGGVFRVVTDGRNGFTANTLAPFGIEELGGYAGIYPERLNRLFSFIEFGTLRGAYDRWVIFTRHNQWRFYDMMNVRYFLTARGAPAPSPDLRLAFRQEIDVYENPRALPRAFVVHRALVEKEAEGALRAMAAPWFEPGSTVVLEQEPSTGFAPAIPPHAPGRAEISRYDEDRIEITADLSANGWLVVSNTFFPGWEATSDGKPTALQRADCAIMAIPLGAGRHDVVLEYRPGSIALGKYLSLLGIVLVLGGAAASSSGLRARVRALRRTGGTMPS